MKVHVEFDTENPADAKALESLFGTTPETTAVTSGVSDFPTQSERQEAAKKQTRKKAEPKSAPTEEPEDAMAQAIALATKMVSDGEAKKVKEALASAGANRVSELKGDAVAKFLEALS